MNKIFTFLLLFLSTLSYGQQQDVAVEIVPQKRTFELSIIQVSPEQYPEVAVTFQAHDQEGRPLWLLDKQYFGVQENGHDCEVLQLKNITNDKALNIGVVLDESGSMVAALESAKAGVLTFLNEDIAEKDAVMFVGFSDSIEQVIPLTKDYKQLEEQIKAVEAGGGTAFYDALYISVKELNASSDAKSVIVALTDGLDNNSSYSIGQVIAISQKMQTPIYSIGLGNVNSVELELLSEETGGMYYHTDDPEALSEIYKNIKSQIRSIYQLDYHSNEDLNMEGANRLQFYFKNDTLSFADHEVYLELPEEVRNAIQSKRSRKKISWSLAGLGLLTILGFTTFTILKPKPAAPKLYLKKVYPNPFHNFVTIEMEDFNRTLPIEINIVDIHGKSLKHKSISSKINVVNLALNHLSPGSYVLQITQQGETIATHKLIKQ